LVDGCWLVSDGCWWLVRWLVAAVGQLCFYHIGSHFRGAFSLPVPKMQVFEELLLDADYSINAGNWMWLSASAFFHHYTRIFCPVRFGRRTDPEGQYIR